MSPSSFTILKFGGTSVGAPDRMHQVAELVEREGGKRLVVLSAVSGTTNALVAIGQSLHKLKRDQAKKQIAELRAQYDAFVQGLLKSTEAKAKGAQIIDHHFETITRVAGGAFTGREERELLAQGELLSTHLFQAYLHELGRNSVLLSALAFMRIDEYDEPDLPYIEERLSGLIAQHPSVDLFVTQGYICLNERVEIDNLKRGGSDYTASLVGAALRAEEVQIWTDIDGMHNNDPRIVKETRPIAELSFDEAAELAYFGAKILHPFTIRPAKDRGIPVRLKNTMDPAAGGTLIAENTEEGKFKAVAAKDGITAIKIKSGRMLLAYGFLRKVFEVFEKHKTSIDMITTSEVAVSLTIDDVTHLEAIVTELEKFGFVEVDKEMAIICIVGSNICERKGVMHEVFEALGDLPLRMVSFGGSRNNVSLLVPAAAKNDTLKALNQGIFKLG